jgi:hypothetical protein
MATKKTKRTSQAVIDALVTLTQSGLLQWKVTGSVMTTLTAQPKFSLDGFDLMGAGFRMQVTREQACAIGYAAVEQSKQAGA